MIRKIIFKQKIDKLFDIQLSNVFLNKEFRLSIVIKLLPHCPKNELNLCITTEPVTDVPDATIYICLEKKTQAYSVGSFFFFFPLDLPHTGQAKLLFRDSVYFWDSVSLTRVWFYSLYEFLLFINSNQICIKSFCKRYV